MSGVMNRAHAGNMQQKDQIIRVLEQECDGLKAALRNRNAVDMFVAQALNGAVSGLAGRVSDSNTVEIIANLSADIALATASAVLDKINKQIEQAEQAEAEARAKAEADAKPCEKPADPPEDKLGILKP